MDSKEWMCRLSAHVPKTLFPAVFMNKIGSNIAYCIHISAFVGFRGIALKSSAQGVWVLVLYTETEWQYTNEQCLLITFLTCERGAKLNGKKESIRLFHQIFLSKVIAKTSRKYLTFYSTNHNSIRRHSIFFFFFFRENQA